MMESFAEINWRLFAIVTLNGLTLASLYFIVASGFSLIFGLMRVVNMAHGSLYLLGAYVGFEVTEATESWLLGILAAGVVVAAAGAALQVSILSWMQGQDLRQALATIGVSIVAADLMLAHWGGSAYQITLPTAMSSFVPVPVAGRYAMARLMLIGFALLIGVGLWLMLNRTRLGMVIRAGVDDRRMLEATGVNVPLVFVGVFAIGASLAGMAGVIGGTVLSVSPGEDARYLLSSLIVVIVGGMGSIPGAAIGALLVAMAETYGLAYTPTYGIVYTFAIMVAVLAVRPQGLLGRSA
ncbi:amino acid/amide ABC transporter membrane protein 1, HAAT family [Palleronia marisminoris]|uniref:High-affinity branched-chain amino acid transport system permease protein LivH n=2 Tax=Palleronia marisminoris TaxID=315423 RepID=A0A1Y5TUY8_9RHOB|nr:amino acid/amide ABC transporter membrane protein 1, HAAT family [Palleronia marisminoris]SLN70834.1 High-affinity branched-chain amino acid transport system permease protein LivH [Palleronia marisminoris]